MISLVAAMDKNRVIGNKNRLPWKLPSDMKRFVRLTKGKPIIMGRKTFESIGKPLKDRINIILTKDKNYQKEGCIVAHSVDAAIDVAGHDDELMVIGGQKIYEQFLPKADRMYLTIVEHEFQGDAFFPKFDKKQWKKIEETKHTCDDKNPYSCSFLTLEKKKFIK